LETQAWRRKLKKAQRLTARVPWGGGNHEEKLLKRKGVDGPICENDPSEPWNTGTSKNPIL